MNLAEDRFSVRNFDSRQIEKEKLERILRAGQVAPTAANRQPQRVIVFQSEDGVKLIRQITRMAFNAPTVLLVCADMTDAWVGVDSHNSGPIDAAIAVTHMMLQAWDEGIGSCWCRGFDANKMHDALGLPENMQIVAMLPIGYPAEGVKPVKGWHDSRKPLEETVKYL